MASEQRGRFAELALFQEAVDKEVLGRQPVDAFFHRNRKDARKILENKLGTYLAYRAVNINNLFGADDFLPGFIKRLLDWLRTLGLMRADQEFEFALLLANQLAFACKSAWDVATQQSTGYARQRDLANFVIDDSNVFSALVVTAAAVGQLNTVINTVFYHGYHLLWNKWPALDGPLPAAAAGNHWVVVEYIVNFFKLYQRTHPNAGYEAAFRNAIDVSLTRQHSEMSLFLLDVYHRYLPAISDPVRAILLEKAAKNPDNRVYVAVQALRTNSHVITEMKVLEMVCKDNNIPKIHLLFSTTSLDPKQGCYDNSWKDPLSVAANAGNYQPVVALLNMGAHPDGVPNCRPSERPLWRAVVSNNVDMVILLLVWGASRDGFVFAWNISTSAFKCRRQKILQHLRHGPPVYCLNSPCSTINGATVYGYLDR